MVISLKNIPQVEEFSISVAILLKKYFGVKQARKKKENKKRQVLKLGLLKHFT